MVIPAKTGIQFFCLHFWIPASAGMTTKGQAIFSRRLNFTRLLNMCVVLYGRNLIYNKGIVIIHQAFVIAITFLSNFFAVNNSQLLNLEKSFLGRQ